MAINVGGKSFLSSELAASYARSLGGGNYQRRAPRRIAPIVFRTFDPYAKKAWKKALKQFKPGGGFTKGIESALVRGEKRAVAGGMQKLISAGLGGTTKPAGLARAYEEEVGTPTRSKAEMERVSNLAKLYAQYGQARQAGRQTAEAHALQQRLGHVQARTQLATTGMQTAARRSIAAGQLGLGQQRLGFQRNVAKSKQELAQKRYELERRETEANLPRQHLGEREQSVADFFERLGV